MEFNKEAIAEASRGQPGGQGARVREAEEKHREVSLTLGAASPLEVLVLVEAAQGWEMPPSCT